METEQQRDQAHFLKAPDQWPQSVGEWREIDREVVYENAWIRVTHSPVRNPNGGKGIYGVVHFKNLAIGIIPVDTEGYTYLVGQERLPLGGKYTWEIIEGGGPLDHDPLASALRELQEEAGLAAQHWQLLQKMDLSNSATTEQAIIYLATGLSALPKAPEETEKLTLKKVPLQEAIQAVLNGEIQDSLSVAGLLKVAYLRGDGAAETLKLPKAARR
jgi:8-oxo-dGTP pyrophosphatase MutT (NUDIX family)